MRALRWLLEPLAPLYGGIVRARNRAFDQHPGRCHRVEAPVVSIGNLTTGGTGKTPVTLFLARGLEAVGWPIAVLSRGYGGRRKVDPMDVEPASEARSPPATRLCGLRRQRQRIDRVVEAAHGAQLNIHKTDDFAVVFDRFDARPHVALRRGFHLAQRFDDRAAPAGVKSVGNHGPIGRGRRRGQQTRINQWDAGK